MTYSPQWFIKTSVVCGFFIAALSGSSVTCAVTCAETCAETQGEAETLHEAIDRLIAAKATPDRLAPSTGDANFLRRAYLDFAGRIPNLEETTAFLTDHSPEKRVGLIDRLLASPEYPRRMEELVHVMLMERRGSNEQWSHFLRSSFENDLPWDQLVRDILCPNEADDERRGAAFFFTRRLEKFGQQATDFPGLTRDVGRLFMGVDLQCAQCHDHLFVDDYKQEDFQGLYAVFSKTFIKSAAPSPDVGQKPLTSELEFVSVFVGEKQTTGPRVPFGKQLDIPALEEGKEKAQEDASKSSLALIAKELATGENRLFVHNAVNRLWFTLMGRGIVHPLDLHNSDNPPSHPELIDLLGREFVAHEFDTKWLLRELALTQTYARTSEVGTVGQGDKLPPPESFAIGVERRLSAEQLLRSVLVATGDGEMANDEHRLDEAIGKLEPKFLEAFANPAKEPEDTYNATLAGALFLLNDPTIQTLLEPASNSLVRRLIGCSDAKQIADELYLRILVRRPTAEESAEVASLLDRFSGERRDEGISHLVWALVSSLEFSVNH